MQKELRSGACRAMLKGLLTAVGITLPGMALLAFLVVYANLSDGTLTALNQALKLAAIFFGAYQAVGRGGTRGLALGGAVGLMYIAGLALGGVSGALTANLPAGREKMKRRAA